MQRNGNGHRKLQLRSHVVSYRRIYERKRSFHCVGRCRYRDRDGDKYAGSDEIWHGFCHGSAAFLHHHFGTGSLHSIHRQYQRNLAVQRNGHGHRKLQLCSHVVCQRGYR